MKLSARLLALLLTVIMLFSLAACSSSGDSTPTDGSDTATEATQAPTSKPTSKPTARPTEAVVDSSNIKNLIIIIGDGMGLAHINAGQLAENKEYPFTKWQNSVCNTNSITSSGSEVLTDSAASATALATGPSTINGYVGIDKYGADVNTILDLAYLYGKSTGIVTTDYLYGATPAGFSAHCNDRNNSEEITFSQIESEVNFLCGLRNDSFYTRYYRNEMDYNEVYYSTDINDAAIMESEKVFLPVDIENGKTGAIELKYASAAALDFLSRNEEGFVLMIEQAYIDKYSHSNDIDNMLYRMKSLNETVEMVSSWASDRDDTAIIVTADHECGGFYSSVESMYDSSYNGSNGPLYYDWTSTNHTQSKVGIYVYGVEVNFSRLSAYNTEARIKNTDVYVLMKNILNLR